MSNDNQNQPQFSIEKIYTKDISFENPNAPEVFVSEGQPKTEMNLNIENRQVDENHWEVSLKITALARNSQDDSVLFEVEVEQAGLFLAKNIPEEHMPALLSVDCPTVIFPYTRQVISQLVSDGGFMPLLVEPVNFAAMYQHNLAQAEQQEATTH